MATSPIKIFPASSADGTPGRASDIGAMYPWNNAYNSRDTIADARPEPMPATTGRDPSPMHTPNVPAGGWNNGNIGWGVDSVTPPMPLPGHVTPWTGLTSGRKG